jgi:DNA-nicking Smr family endonuclease
MARKVTDFGLWHQAVRDVAPLPGRARPQPPLPTAPADEPRQMHAPAAPDGVGLDRANAEKLKRGRHPIAARLDLHGLTQREAHRALADFVARSREFGRRCVLVITGRGLAPTGPGVLKTAVPRWLAEPEFRRHILMVAPAQPQHGGAGALYVLLRRRR